MPQTFRRFVFPQCIVAERYILSVEEEEEEVLFCLTNKDNKTVNN